MYGLYNTHDTETLAPSVNSMFPTSYDNDILAPTLIPILIPGCFFVAALMPREFDTGSSDTKNLARGAAHASKGTQESWQMLGHTVPANLATASTSVFGGRLAYAVVDRAGTSKRYPDCLAFWWHGVYEVARWAAIEGGFEWDPATVVLRTRPDILLTKTFAIANLQRYFETGVRGRHLSLSRYGSTPIETTKAPKGCQKKPRGLHKRSKIIKKHEKERQVKT